MFDRFSGNTGNIMILSSSLKSPEKLADVWLAAAVKGRAPLAWSIVATTYLPALHAIKSQAEINQVKQLHLQDWPAELFGNKALDIGKSQQECWASLREANPAAAASIV